MSDGLLITTVEVAAVAVGSNELGAGTGRCQMRVALRPRVAGLSESGGDGQCSSNVLISAIAVDPAPRTWSSFFRGLSSNTFARSKP